MIKDFDIILHQKLLTTCIVKKLSVCTLDDKNLDMQICLKYLIVQRLP